jgi:ATP-dependent RNA helicase DDX35
MSVCPAIDDKCMLTDPLGLRMAEFPLDPKLSRMLLMSGEFLLLFLLSD